jgi:hypothetical protein
MRPLRLRLPADLRVLLLLFFAVVTDVAAQVPSPAAARQAGQRATTAPTTTAPSRWPETLGPYGRPTDANTGPRDRSALDPAKLAEDRRAKVSLAEGEVLEGRRFPGLVQVWADGNGSQVRRCRFDGGVEIIARGNDVVVCDNAIAEAQGFFVVTNEPSYWGGESASRGLLIEHNEIQAPGAGCVISGSNYTARRNHIHHARADVFNGRDNILIEGNYVHDFATGKADEHADFLQIGTPVREGVRILGNHVVMNVGKVDNAIVFFNGSGPLEVDYNWFSGGSYAVRTVVDPQQRVKFRGNVFAEKFTYNVVLLLGADGRDLLWEGNRVVRRNGSLEPFEKRTAGRRGQNAWFMSVGG